MWTIERYAASVAKKVGQLTGGEVDLADLGEYVDFADAIADGQSPRQTAKRVLRENGWEGPFAKTPKAYDPGDGCVDLGDKRYG